MKTINDSIRAAVKIDGLPERAEFGSWEEVLQALTKYLVVEIPQGVSGVIATADEPNDDQRGKIWLRLNGNGGITAVYYYVQGFWKPMYNYPQGGIQWIYGDSENPPEGFTAILDGDGYVDSQTVAQLRNRYVLNPGGEGYIYYAARFSGY